MPARERSSSSCTHSTPWTLSSSSWTTPLRTTSPSELPCRTPCAPITRNEDYGSLAKTHPPTGYQPNVLDTSDEFEVLLSIFQGSNVDKIYNLGAENEEPANAERDDEHMRNALALPLFLQESEAEASLRQTYHLNEEGFSEGAQSVLASTVRPVVWPTHKAKVKPKVGQDHFGYTKRSNRSREQNPRS